MYSRPRSLLKYVRYFLLASNGKGHGVHSPFVFDFITKILNDKTPYPEYGRVESLRQRLLKNQTVLNVDDLGAGSSFTRGNRRTVASIARWASKSKKFGRLLFRMARYYQPQRILELGTSLGISAAYLALPGSMTRMISIEGSRSIAAMARLNLASLEIGNCTVMEGNFDSRLGPALQELSGVDLAFIDGNHRREPTERYFDQLLPYISNDSILIFDDIHWSREMEGAWKAIRGHPRVTCSIDLFSIGILFFRQELIGKQDFTIRF